MNDLMFFSFQSVIDGNKKFVHNRKLSRNGITRHLSILVLVLTFNDLTSSSIDHFLIRMIFISKKSKSDRHVMDKRDCVPESKSIQASSPFAASSSPRT